VTPVTSVPSGTARGSIRSRVRASGRWFSLTGLVLAGLCFLLPFALVSCDAPGGYGRVKAGGSTTYTGVDLATGDEPDVTRTHLRPAAEQREDQLPPQPLVIAAFALILAGAAAVILFRDPNVRRPTVALAGAIAAVFLAAAALAVPATLEARLQEQLTAPMPAGKSAADFVHVGNGLWLSLVLVCLAAVANAVAWLLGKRRRPEGFAELPTDEYPVAPTTGPTFQP
jgi:hypothetical protein